MNIEEILLWLFVLVLGTAFGAGFYEMRVVLPLWFASPPESIRSPDSGKKFWAIVTTLPLTSLAVANLIVALGAPEPRRDWWFAAAAVILVERLMTFAYFIPSILRLERSAAPPAEVRAASAQWRRLNLLRVLLLLVSWLGALKVLSLPAA